ncbi:DUF4932 domain-containing protein [Marinicella meishanensis]|uniref:DUF4932 domain-containing protein n=1 Tax=Marinicella meishanensis TaxID=2873263 RepID=UPI001CC0C899|nr:DUF4932 domain-containing protein [Marinicella sp. NBU2979]
MIDFYRNQNKFLLLAATLLYMYCENSYSGNNELQAWFLQDLEFTIIMDSVNIPPGIPNSQSSRINLFDAINEWNLDPSFNYDFFNVQIGQVSNSVDRVNNGLNEIKFYAWDRSEFGADTAGYNFRFATREYNTNTPGFPNTKVYRIIESDVYMNPNILWTLDTNNCANRYHAPTILKHEIGHAFGLLDKYSSLDSRNVMFGNIPKCTSKHINPRDWRNLRDRYPSQYTVDINIQSPGISTVVIANEPTLFSADLVPFGSSRSSFTDEEIKAMEHQLIWTSSIDGEIVEARGNNRYVTGLSAGEHQLTVSIGQPGDDVYGDGTSSFFVVDQVITTEADNFHPYPCPRSIGHDNNPCLLSTKYSLYRYRCINHSYNHGNRSARDRGDNLVSPNDDTNIPVYLDPFPRCLTDYTTYDFKFYTWLHSDDNLVNFELNYILEDLFDPAEYRTYQHPIPLVNSEIFVYEIEDCEVANTAQKCSTNIIWEDLYFAPDAGIFYRSEPTAEWELLKLISERNGSYQTGNIVDTNGVEFAVFQYARDVRGQDENGNPGRGVRYIQAPRGIMAGPISVQAIAADTTPLPVIESVGTISTNNYKVELIGENFGTNPIVSVRENKNGSPVLKEYSSAYFHNYGTNSSGKNFIRFPIVDVNRQNKFNGNGLCFKVINGTLPSNDEVCYERPNTSSQPAFAGAFLQSYHDSNQTQDIHPESYIVKAGGTMLKIWGNSWKKLPMNYNVTANTELEFQFRSTLSEVEFAGVGFIMNGQTNMSPSRFWQLHGTQSWGNQQHNDYSGTAYKTYTINAGEQFTGQISHVVFVSNKDVQPVAHNVVFQSPSLSENVNVTPTGSLSSDSPCTLTGSNTTCTVTIDVTKQNTPISCLWKTAPDVGLVTCLAASSWSRDWTWTNVNGHTVQLRAHDNYPSNDPGWPGNMQTLLNNAPLLDQIDVVAQAAAPSATGTLTSNSPCTLTGNNSTCTVSLNVQKQNTPISCIWKTAPDVGLVTCLAANSWNRDWTWTNVNGHTMQLRAHDDYPTQDPGWPGNMLTQLNAAPLLDQTQVVALPATSGPSGSLTSNSPCTLTDTETRCTVTINVIKQDTPIACLWKTAPDVGVVTCLADDSWSRDWTWTNVNGHTMQLRAHDDYPTQDPGWPDNMMSLLNNAPLLDEEVVIAVQ